MADIKISQLGAAIAVGDTDLVPIVSGGNTLKATAAQVKEHSIGNTNISNIGDGSVTGAISALNTDKQPKTLATPLTIGGVSKTTVEDALGGLVSENQTLTNQATDMVNVLGAKNLLPNNATTQTVRGVTFTVNSDGSVTANGTAASGSNPFIKLTENFTVPRSGQYIVSGNPIAGDIASGNWTTDIYLSDLTSGVHYDFDSTGDEQYYFDSTHIYQISVYVKAEATVSNAIFKPMIRPASISDNTYVPYAKTNRQIVANDKAKTTITYSDSNVSIDPTYSGYIAKNGWVFWQLRFKTTDTAQHEIGVILPPNAFGDYVYITGYYAGGSTNENRIEIRINQSGGVRLRNFTETDNWIIVNGCYPIAE